MGFLPTALVALFAGLATTVQPRSCSTDAASLRAIHAVADGIVAADNARDIERVLSYYAPDAILMPPNEAPVSSRAAIRPRYEALFRDFDPVIEGRVDEACASGDHGYVRGRNGGSLRSRAGTLDRRLDDSYLMLVTRNAAGQWRISHLMWHRASAAP